MNPLVAVGEKANVYPQKYHWKMTTALLANTAQMRETVVWKECKYRFSLWCFNVVTYEHFSVGQGLSREKLYVTSKYLSVTIQDEERTKTWYHQEHHGSRHDDKRDVATVKARGGDRLVFGQVLSGCVDLRGDIA